MRSKSAYISWTSESAGSWPYFSRHSAAMRSIWHIVRKWSILSIPIGFRASSDVTSMPLFANTSIKTATGAKQP
ncbi:hypothetical protein D3C84_1231050 [compost metagenome]